MKKLSLILLFVGLYSNAQTEFSLDSEKGMTDFIVTPVEGKTANEIYKKAIDWVKITYKNPDHVILSTIENEYLRFEGSSETLFPVRGLGKVYYPAKYQIEISIKDGKYKFDVISMQANVPTFGSPQGSWIEYPFFSGDSTKKNPAEFYRKDGRLKNLWQYLPEVPVFFNELNKSLIGTINSVKSTRNDW